MMITTRLAPIPEAQSTESNSVVQGFEEELGYLSLSELQEYRGALGIGIERDLHFKPTPLSQLHCCDD